MDESHNTEGKKPGKTVHGIFYKTQKIYMVYFIKLKKRQNSKKCQGLG